MTSFNDNSTAGDTTKLMQGHLSRQINEFRDGIDIALKDTVDSIYGAFQWTGKLAYGIVAFPCTVTSALRDADCCANPSSTNSTEKILTETVPSEKAVEQNEDSPEVEETNKNEDVVKEATVEKEAKGKEEKRTPVSKGSVQGSVVSKRRNKQGEAISTKKLMAEPRKLKTEPSKKLPKRKLFTPRRQQHRVKK